MTIGLVKRHGGTGSGAIGGALRLVVSLGLAAGVTLLLWPSEPSLSVTTDIIGYPTFANFNVFKYFRRYLLLSAFFPLLAMGCYFALTRITRRGRSPRAPLSSPPPTTAEIGSATLTWPWVALRLLFVGAVLATELGIAIHTGDRWVSRLLVPGAIGYAMAGLLAGRALAKRSDWHALEGASAINASIAPTALLGLGLASQATRVTTASTGTIQGFAWLPVWAAGLLAIAAWVSIFIWRRRHPETPWAAVERRVLFIAAGPVALFLLVAFVPGELGPLDTFHEGEGLAGARLTVQGAMPWRDLYFTHGLLEDVIVPATSLWRFGDTRWAFQAGQRMLWIPVYWLGMYALLAYVFRRHIGLLVAAQLSIVLGIIGAPHYRLFLIAPTLLLLALLLAAPTKPRAAAFTTLLATQAVLTPEAGFAVPTFLVIVVAFEAYYRDRSRPLREEFRRTMWCAGTGAVMVVLFGLALVATGTLGDYIFYYRTFAPGHELTGGVPLVLEGVDRYFVFAAVAPVVLTVGTLVFFVARTRLGRPLAVEDWVLGASALFAWVYYRKFLSRADGHVYQAFATAVPLLLYALYKVAVGLASVVDGTLRRLRSKVSLPAVIPLQALIMSVVIALAPLSGVALLQSVPARFAPVVASDPVAGMGYAAPGVVNSTMIHDVGHVLSRLLKPEDALFDFSNNPAVFHYLLDRPAATRYYAVSMAIRVHTQRDLIRDLEAERPEVVIFTATSGLPWWDGIANQVRHYDVSAWLLRNYRPLLISHGYLVLVPEQRLVSVGRLSRGMVEPPTTKDLYFWPPPCDWGYSPNFLPRQNEVATRTPLRVLRRSGLMEITGWAANVQAGRPAHKVVAWLDGEILAQTEVGLDRPDVAVTFGNEGVRRSGFNLLVPVPKASSDEALRRIHLYLIDVDGGAVDVTFAPGQGWTARDPLPEDALPTIGPPVTLAPGRFSFSVDSARRSSEEILRVQLPPEHTRFSRLEIRSGRTFKDERVRIGDDFSIPNHMITVRTLPRSGDKIDVQVEACSAWWGYTGDQLDVVAPAGMVGELALLE